MQSQEYILRDELCSSLCLLSLHRAKHALQLHSEGHHIGEKNYLDVVEPFLERYAGESPQNARAVGARTAGSFWKGVEGWLRVGGEGKGDEREEGEGEGEGEPSSKPLLVFFPGIPGCGKSAITQILLEAPDWLGDGRALESLSGDAFGDGKQKKGYWREVSKWRTKEENQGKNLIADKNAPNLDVWEQIQAICDRTVAVGVPVVPDSPGTEHNPFDPRVLALFIFRVLQRKGHQGRLDGDSLNPGQVLLEFRRLYAPRTREDLLADLTAMFGHVVKLPVVREGAAELPREIEELIARGIELERKLFVLEKAGKAEAKAAAAAAAEAAEKLAAEEAGEEAAAETPVEEAADEVAAKEPR